MYIMDVMNGAILGLNGGWDFCRDYQKAFVMTAQVENAFNMHPGLYEKKWDIDKEEFLPKFYKLDEAARATLAIWSKLLWCANCGSFEESPFFHLFDATYSVPKEQVIDDAIREYLTRDGEESLVRAVQNSFVMLNLLKSQGVNENTCMMAYLVMELLRSLPSENQMDVWVGS
jgi:hypothetical protein